MAQSCEDRERELSTISLSLSCLISPTCVHHFFQRAFLPLPSLPQPPSPSSSPYLYLFSAIYLYLPCSFSFLGIKRTSYDLHHRQSNGEYAPTNQAQTVAKWRTQASWRLIRGNGNVFNARGHVVASQCYTAFFGHTHHQFLAPTSSSWPPCPNSTLHSQ